MILVLRRLFLLSSVALFLVGCNFPSGSYSEEVQGVVEKAQSAINPVVENLNSEALKEKKASLEAQINIWQEELNDKKDKTEAKIEEVQEKMAEAQAAYQEVREALDRLSVAADELKVEIIPQSQPE